MLTLALAPGHLLFLPHSLQKKIAGLGTPTDGYKKCRKAGGVKFMVIYLSPGDSARTSRLAAEPFVRWN